MPESRPPIDVRGLDLAAVQRHAAERRLPPVDRWDPPHCGHSGIRIAADGNWFHQGRPIERPALVRLFSTILRREADGRHVLVTPVEKLDIDVESTAFRAIAMTCQGEGRDRRIGLALDSGDALVIGPDHPLTMAASTHGPSPRVLVRHGLEAELSRPVYYELAELALAQSDGAPGLWSDGCFFSLDAAA